MSPSPPPQPRRFQVHARMRGRHHARLFNALSFEAAAIAYVESAEFEAEAEDPIKLVVRDLGGGEEHCFTIDLASGESAECAPN